MPIRIGVHRPAGASRPRTSRSEPFGKTGGLRGDFSIGTKCAGREIAFFNWNFNVDLKGFHWNQLLEELREFQKLRESPEMALVA